MKQFGTGIALIGSGSYTPDRTITNEDLSHLVDTNDEWITTRTGIKSRHVAPENVSLSQLGAEAARKAIAMAGIKPEQIDLIILATSTADDLFGSACQIQHLIGAHQAVAFDLTAACSGFVFGLVTASQFLRTGAYRHCLVIGADVLSRWVDWSDRGTCILFGDGAGAVVCKATEDQDSLLGFDLHSNGAQNSSLNLAYEGHPHYLINDVTITQGRYQPITMNGKEVYRFAVEKVPEVIEKTLFKTDLAIEDIDWLVLHQANQRIISTVAQRLGMDEKKVIVNLDQYGNTSAASIPLALDEAIRKGQVKKGDTIAAAGFGAGLSWGAAIFKWG
ncbi:MAG: ketoacyl-ACP synthase III [Synechococcaceae cyanobacterium RL_1_2]|nr:ketoacyl-ACP synthase III [Synechococcaceae cyanobacterium RL_1_2]